MDAASIKGEAFMLQDLFEHWSYDIDYYQREFAWSMDDIRTLIDDLVKQFQSAKRDPRTRKGMRHADPLGSNGHITTASRYSYHQNSSTALDSDECEVRTMRKVTGQAGSACAPRPAVQRVTVVRGGVEPPTFGFSGQPR
jgi:hypothetical protein